MRPVVGRLDILGAYTPFFFMQTGDEKSESVLMLQSRPQKFKLCRCTRSRIPHKPARGRTPWRPCADAKTQGCQTSNCRIYQISKAGCRSHGFITASSEAGEALRGFSAITLPCMKLPTLRFVLELPVLCRCNWMLIISGKQPQRKYPQNTP
jgi:hypothetical protein